MFNLCNPKPGQGLGVGRHCHVGNENSVQSVRDCGRNEKKSYVSGSDIQICKIEVHRDSLPLNIVYLVKGDESVF